MRTECACLGVRDARRVLCIHRAVPHRVRTAVQAHMQGPLMDHESWFRPMQHTG